ncbi:MAG: hypothetical protein U0935_15960 [Pirellulales bacterium]
MQRPSFALAVLFGALASGLLVANVAPCQVIVVLHELPSTADSPPPAATPLPEPQAPPEFVPPAEPEYAPAEAPIQPAPVDVAPLSGESPPAVASTTLPSEAPAPVTVAPASEPAIAEVSPPPAAPVESAPAADAPALPPRQPATECPLPEWLGTADLDPVDAVAATPSAAAAVTPAEASQSEPMGGTVVAEDVAKSAVSSLPAAESLHQPESAVNSAESTNPVQGAPTAGNAAEVESVIVPDVSLEPLREAARDAARDTAITLDTTASWIHQLATQLRSWAEPEHVNR